MNKILDGLTKQFSCHLKSQTEVVEGNGRALTPGRQSVKAEANQQSQQKQETIRPKNCCDQKNTKVI